MRERDWQLIYISQASSLYVKRGGSNPNFLMFAAHMALSSLLHRAAPKLFDRPAFTRVSSTAPYTSLLRRMRVDAAVVAAAGVTVFALVATRATSAVVNLVWA